MCLLQQNRTIQISLNEMFNNEKCVSIRHFFSSFVFVYYKYRRKKLSRSRLSTSKMLVKLNIVGGNHKVLFQTCITHVDEAHTTCKL